MTDGANIKTVKKQNRILLLRQIALSAPISRVDLSRSTGLSKMTVGNQVRELIEQKLVEELSAEDGKNGSPNKGRPSIMLKISDQSPCICGMLIKRGYCQIILADISGHIFERMIDYQAEDFDADSLIKALVNGYRDVAKRTARPIIAIGVSSIGPVNAITGVILNPPNFCDIKNIPIVEILSRETGLPTFLINDANAGALAEKMYGQGKQWDHFVYLHIMNGVGAGPILQGKLYNGMFGQSGEIGHTSINFSGPKCTCGNTGCLDLYANVANLQHHIREFALFYPNSPLNGMDSPSWLDIVDAANDDDGLAISALEKFCGYVGSTMVNVLNILDVSRLVVGYDSRKPGDIIERLLYHKVSGEVIYSSYRDVEIRHSVFWGDAPLAGSIAHVADKIFDMSLEL